jgi:hypothetical protein
VTVLRADLVKRIGGMRQLISLATEGMLGIVLMALMTVKGMGFWCGYA